MRHIKRVFFLCALTLLVSCMGIGAKASSNQNSWSGVYALLLNDYLYTYGAINTQEAGERFYDSAGLSKEGVIYSGLIDFDKNEDPYLVIFLSDGGYNVISCHVWKFNGINADRIAVIDKKMNLDSDEAGEFSIGTKDGDRFIVYTRYQNDIPSDIEFYTARNGDFLKFMTQPQKVGTIGVVDFNRYYLHPGIDVSNGNRQLFSFFETLKSDIISTSVYRNVVEAISQENRQKLEEELSNTSCDLSRTGIPNEDTGKKSGFQEIKSVYALGSEFYYTVFSTEAASFNYAFFRYTGSPDHPFHIIKFRCDSIPQNDLQLRELKSEYMDNELAGTASETSLIPDGYCVEDVALEIDPDKQQERQNPEAVQRRNTVLCITFIFCFGLLVCLIAVFIKR